MSYETKSELYAKFLAAAGKGDLAEVEACRNRGADPEDARDNGRRTALHLAAMNGHVALVKYFLEDRVDARLLDEDFKTPLTLSAARRPASCPANPRSTRSSGARIIGVRSAGNSSSAKSSAASTIAKLSIRSWRHPSMILRAEPSSTA